MNKAEETTNLEQLLDRIDESTRSEVRVTLGTILEAVGSRSFGSILLIPGMVLVVPGIGDIPGVTTAMAILVFLISGQVLLGKKHLWFPAWLLKRSVKRERIGKAIGWFRNPARFIDHLIRERLTMLNSSIVIAMGCMIVGLVMPFMEVIPFAGIIAGVALTAFGLALVAKDGLLALLAYVATATTIGAGLYSLL